MTANFIRLFLHQLLAIHSSFDIVGHNFCITIVSIAIGQEGGVAPLLTMAQSEVEVSFPYT